MYKRIVAACLFVGLSGSFALAQTTRVVDRDGQGSVANCHDASAAFATVGAAISAAANGDTILVCPGTYVENINFAGKAIAIRSVAGAAVTILDGNAIDSVVKFVSNESSSSVLEGFTVRNGGGSFASGGIQISAASPIIRRNLVIGTNGCSTPGISISGGSPLIEYNTIANNISTCSGIGGGVVISNSAQAVVRRNTIANNTGVGYGGGIALWSSGASTVESNLITGNAATNGGGIAIVNPSSSSIVGNLIVRNQAQSGGGIYWTVPGTLVVNNTIADNNSSSGSAVFAGASGTTSVGP